MTSIADIEKKLDDHIEYCRNEFRTGENEFQELKRLLRENTAAITVLSTNTEGVVSAYGNIQGAAKVGAAIQKFGVWIVKWPLIATGFFAILKWIIDNADQLP